MALGRVYGVNEGKTIVSLKKREDSFEVQHSFDREFLGQMGVWTLIGKKDIDSKFVCLNVGKSTDVGREILYDLACLIYVKSSSNTSERPYINQFGEYCCFGCNYGETQESLYPYLADTYTELFFILAYKGATNDSNRMMEKKIAHKYHALFWRNGKAFERYVFDNPQVAIEMTFIDVTEFKDSLLDCCRSEDNGYDG